MPFQILPTETRFYDLFEEHARTLQAAASQLRELVEDYADVEAKVARLTETEHEGDRVVHEVIDLARRSFTTPFDADDLTAIAGRIDDCIDGIHEVADALHLWKVERPSGEAIQLAHIIEQGAVEIAAAVPHLRDKRRFDLIRAHNVEVNRLENDADRVARAALSRLLDAHEDMFDLIRWKEIYEQLEAVTDRLEDVADALEGVTVKHG
ncbi:DUF47 family protein [soil metagenome]